jgi:hypothetical protein
MCQGLDGQLCDRVLAAAIHNLARNASVFIGPAVVIAGPCYIPMADYFPADASCWYVSLPLSTGITPHVVMARRTDGVIAQAGGDPISGQATVPDVTPYEFPSAILHPSPTQGP